MKCKRCGATARSLSAMAAHYRKKHPSAMKRTTKKVTRRRLVSGDTFRAKQQYCSKCGQPI